MGLIFYLSAQPRLPSPTQAWLAELLADAAHFVVYAVLAFLWWRALSRHYGANRAILAATFGIAVLYGASDEFHQSFVPGRDPSWLDLLLDAAGAAMALWVVNKKNTKDTRVAK